MEKRPFHLKQVAIALAITIPIVTFPMWYLKLFPPATLYCVDVRNGEVVKLYDADCQPPNSVNVVKR